jgi:hypothetical protein
MNINAKTLASDEIGYRIHKLPLEKQSAVDVIRKQAKDTKLDLETRLLILQRELSMLDDVTQADIEASNLKYDMLLASLKAHKNSLVSSN